MAVTPRTEPWSALLEAGRSDDRLVREAFEGARAPVFGEIPDDLHPTVAQGLANAGIDALYAHQAQALRDAWEATTIVTTGTASGKSLCFNLPTLEVLCTDAKARALYLYPTKALAQDQARALNALRAAQAGAPGDLRRRHPARGAPGHPPALEPRPHQPRHAPRRDPAQPRRVGRLLRQPRRRRGRRGARLPRRLRRPRRQRPAPAAARRRRLRHDAALPARQRDDRQPRRAGRAPHRPGGRAARRRGRLAGRPAPDRDVEPAGGRRGAAAARAAR